MDLKSCGYCNEQVDLSERPHVHDPKICKRCRTELPASDFQSWPSSADGRRHTCRNCVAGDSEEARAERAIQKDKQFHAEKEKLKEYGYRWRRRPVRSGPNPDFVWVLLDPHGREVSNEAALRAIAELEAPSPMDDDFGYF